MSFLNKKAIKDFCKDKGRRVGKDFMSSMERTVMCFLHDACQTHNGGKVTLDNAVASYIGMKLAFTGDDDDKKISE